MRRRLSLLAFILILSPLVSAQQFWEKKPWERWNKGEVQRLLENSPWAQSQGLGNVQVDIADRRPLSGTTADLARERSYSNVSTITYTAQIRSATIVRQALVRQAQLKARYDDMSPEQQQAFDKKTTPFLTSLDPGQIVIYVAFTTSVPSYLIDLQNYWAGQTAGTLQNTMILSLPGGHKLTPVDYSPPTGAGFQVLFQRPSDGVPLGDMRFEFRSPGFANIAEARVFFSFDQEKMKIQGKPDF